MENKGFKYVTRIAEEEIKRKLRTSGAVIIVGPKYCGKTTTASLFAKTHHSFATPTEIDLYSANIKMAIKGETPILIDEWQNIPLVYDEIRVEIDKTGGAFGQYILTGSNSLLDFDEIIHSGVGRFSTSFMYPFSLYESGESSGKVSLKEIFDGKEEIFSLEDDKTLLDIAHYIVRGGWPTSITIENREDSYEVASSYIDGAINYKSRNKRSHFPDPFLAESIFKSYARNVSSPTPYTTIIEDVKAQNGRKLDDETFSSYIQKIRELFLIKDVGAWNPNLRSKVSIRSTPVRQFIDPSLAAASLSLGPRDLLGDLHSFGLFFESLCIRDLRVYSQANRAEVSRYRDNDGLEVDAIVHKKNGDWGAIEIKLGGKDQIESAAKSLLRLKNKIDYSTYKAPSFLTILTATGNAYTREDGIHVFPITMLKD